MKSNSPSSHYNTIQAGLSPFFNRIWLGWRYEILGLILFAGLWAGVSEWLFSQPGYAQFKGFLPGPTLAALGEAFGDARFWLSVFTSMRRVILGISLAAVMGIPVGIFIGFYPLLRGLSYSALQFIRMISPLSWMPIALLLFASFESAVYFLIVMATICPIILNTAIGVMDINPQWIKMAKNQGADNLQIIRTVIIPGTVPHIMTSLRLALGVAWIVLVPAEFLGVSSGLGYLINDARDTMEYDRLMAMIIAIGILGFLLDRTFQKLQSMFNR